LSNEELALRILAFARHCGDAANPVAVALCREWRDGIGHPTPDGRTLIEALVQHEGTRSVLRLVL